MDPSLDRRHDRVPMRVAVKLQHGVFEDSFEADALNLSKGGISMRAPCLPDLRSRLICRFRCLPSGASVTAQGEVVWAHLDGEHSGEFGLAFVDLDPKTEWLIEEMIAEHGVQNRELDPRAPVARLELEGSSEPIAARMAHREAGKAVFEQELDLLSLGRGVLAHAPGAEGRAGSIAAVELRMVGCVPMLAVTVAFEARTDAGALSCSGQESAQSDRDHDTEPDLPAPHERASGASGPNRLAQVTVTEFGAELDDSEHDFSEEYAALGEGSPPLEASGSSKPPPAWSLSPLDFPPPPEPEPALAGNERSADFSHAFVFQTEAERELDAELAAFSRRGLKSAFAPALRALSTAVAALARLLGASGASASQRALPKLRGSLIRCSSILRSLYGRQLAPQLGAARRLAFGLMFGKRRRTTAGPTAAKRSGSGSLGRTLLLGVLSAGAAGLAVYALAPSSHADSVELARRVQPAESSDETAPVAAKASIAESPAAAASAQKVSPSLASPQLKQAQPAAGGAVVGTRAVPAAAPSLEGVPPASPFAVDVRASTGTKPEPAAVSAHGLRFGASKVPRGHRFALRMSARIQSLQGAPDKGGFTLMIPGVLSLDRAGPISSAIKTVKRAMIVNKGDHAELSIRFADDKQPAYQVSAEGSTLYLLIEDM